MRTNLLLAAAAIMLLWGPPLTAQDTRIVTEPRQPAPCVTLKAHISSIHGVIALADEHRLDTGRIQHALDTCSPGKAVLLRSDGPHNVLLTGPLTLHSTDFSSKLPRLQLAPLISLFGPADSACPSVAGPCSPKSSIVRRSQYPRLRYTEGASPRLHPRRDG